MQVFELRQEHKKTFVGGTFANADGSLYDVGKALKNGEGRIETDDPHTIDRLREIEALKATTKEGADGE